MAGITGMFSILEHSDGAKMAYEILGAEHLFRQTPLVLIGGMSSLRGDWKRLADGLATERAGDRFLNVICVLFSL